MYGIKTIILNKIRLSFNKNTQIKLKVRQAQQDGL